MGDLLLDVCFLLSGIAGTAFILIMRKRFDMWVSLLTCTAWVLKGARHLYYDWLLAAVNNVREDDVFLLMRKAHIILEGMDTMVIILLHAALVRMAIVGLYLRWYKKALKSLDK